MPLPIDNQFGLSRSIPIRHSTHDYIQYGTGFRASDWAEPNNNNNNDDDDDNYINAYENDLRNLDTSDSDSNNASNNHTRRIMFAENDAQQQLRRMEIDAHEEEEEDEDEEFFPIEDTYIEEEEDDDDDVEDDDNDDDDDGINQSPDGNVDGEGQSLPIRRRSNLARNSSRSPPPPPPYRSLTRANAAASLASMLNNLTTSSNSLNSHVRRLNNRNAMVVFNDDEEEEDHSENENDDDEDDDVLQEDEVHRRWRVLRRNQGRTDFKIREILNKRMGVKLEDTIFKNHYKSHNYDKTTIGIKRFDLVLNQRQTRKSSHKCSHPQQKQQSTRRKSRKRKNDEIIEINDSDDCDDNITTSSCSSFLQTGIIFSSSNSDNSSSLHLQFTNVSYDENLVNGIIFSSPGDTESMFQFNGSIVNFIDEDLRYLTIHGTDELKFQSSLDRNVMLNDHNKFLQFKKKLDKWYKLPPFNSLQSQRVFEKIITCHHCLNLILKNFLLLKITMLINNKNSLDIEDHLQLLVSINRNSGEMYIVSGELDSFQRCSSCNIIHDSNSTGNSIIDKILILNNDHRLKPFKNLLINIKLLNDLQNRDWKDIREENVWKDNDNNNNNDNHDYLSDKKLKKNDNQSLKRKNWKRSDSSSSSSSTTTAAAAAAKSSMIKYDYDELFVTKFVPKFNQSNGFNCFEVVLS